MEFCSVNSSVCVYKLCFPEADVCIAHCEDASHKHCVTQGCFQEACHETSHCAKHCTSLSHKHCSTFGCLSCSSHGCWKPKQPVPTSERPRCQDCDGPVYGATKLCRKHTIGETSICFIYGCDGVSFRPWSRMFHKTCREHTIIADKSSSTCQGCGAKCQPFSACGGSVCLFCCDKPGHGHCIDQTCSEDHFASCIKSSFCPYHCQRPGHNHCAKKQCAGNTTGMKFDVCSRFHC